VDPGDEARTAEVRRDDRCAVDATPDRAGAVDATPDREGAADDGREAPCEASACEHRPRSIKRELTVGEVAKRSGVAVSAVRFYESIGLIKSRRSRGNHRLYRRDVLRRIAVIKVAQATGMALDDIRQALQALPDERTPTRSDWARLSAAWKADLERRIARLTRLRDQLDRCIGCGCLSMSDCPLRNPGDRLAAEGAGPRLLDPDA